MSNPLTARRLDPEILARQLAEQEAASDEPRDSTLAELHRELETLAEDLRRSDEPDAYAEESACRRVIEAIGRDPSRRDHRAAAADNEEGGVPTELATLGQYRLLSKLGQGGMGAVYRALHMRLDKVVAVKVLPRELTSRPDAVARFEREMRAVGKLHHPNIVAAHDAGESDGTHFLVMELVDGEDVGSIVRRRGPLPVAESCEIIRQAALGLQHAHEHGLVHRDIKPSNLMLAVSRDTPPFSRDPKGSAPPPSTHHSPPTVKILDMGLALLDESHRETVGELTSTGQIMGTLDYMAPEQGADTHAVDIRADIYSLGASLYKLLCGHAPFEGKKYATQIKKLTALATADPERIDTRRPEVPKPLADLVHRMLAKAPQGRPTPPAEVARMLSTFTTDADLRRLFEPATSSSRDWEGAAGVVADTATEPTFIAETNVAQPVTGDGPPGPSTDALREGEAPAEPAALDTSPLSRASRSESKTHALAGEGPEVRAHTPTPAAPSSILHPQSSSPRPPRRLLTAIAGAAAILLLAAVYYIQTNHGTIKVDVRDPSIAVQLRDSGITVENTETERTYTIKVEAGQQTATNDDLPPGEYKVHPVAGLRITDDAGAEFTATTFELKRRGEKLLRVEFAPVAIAEIEDQPAATPVAWTPTPEQQSFFDHVATLPADQQVEAVRKELMRVNPGYDGRFVGDATVQQLIIVSDVVSSIYPLRALPDLQFVGIHGTELRPGSSSLSDLTPLQGSQIEHLAVSNTSVSDLSPLRGLSLTRLYCSNTYVEDLSPVAGMPLTLLWFGRTRVTNLAPLHGLPIVDLDCGDCPIADYSSIGDLRGLRRLSMGCNVQSDISFLKDLRLEYLRLNQTRVSDLSALRGMTSLEHLDIQQTSVVDLSPLQGLPLALLESQVTAISDLSPLRGMPLTELWISDTRVSDLTPLRGMPLQYLHCQRILSPSLTALQDLPLQKLWTDLRLFHPADETILRGIGLEILNGDYIGTPAAEAWKALEARRTAAEEFAAQTAALPAAEQISAVVARLDELNPNATGPLGRVIEEGAVVEASLLVDNRHDVTPLRAFTRLRVLTLTGGPDWLDISPLNSLPLEELRCTPNIAFRNEPVLRGMPTLTTINGRPAAEYLDSLRLPLRESAPPADFALQFDGVDDYVDIPSLRFSADSPWTIEGRYRSEDNFGDIVSYSGGVRVWLAGDRLNWDIRGEETEFNAQTDWNADGVFQNHRNWTSFAVVNNGDGATAHLFINGRRVVDLTADRFNVLSQEPDRYIRLRLLLGGLAVRYWDAPNPGNYFSGEIDEIRISSSARYSDDYPLTDRFEPDDETLALYHFDEGDGAILTDASGNAHHGKIIGATHVAPGDAPPISTPSGDFALQFDGVDDYVDIPRLDYDGSPITVEAMIVDDGTTGSAVVRGSGGGHRLSLWYSPDSSLIGFGVSDGTGEFTSAAALVQEAIPDPHSRIHLAGTFDGERVEIYVDGRKVDVNAHQARYEGYSPDTGFRIGAETLQSGDPIHPFHGIIDEVRISSVVRYTEDFPPAGRFEPDEHTLALYHFDEGEGGILRDASGNGHDGRIIGATWVEQAPAQQRASNEDVRHAAQHILALGGTVRIDNEERDIRNVNDLPPGPFRLTYLGLYGNPEVGDDDLAPLAGCVDLTVIELGETGITDAGLAHLQGCDKLQVLNLWQVAVTDEGVAVFQNCRDLVHLELGGTLITDVALASFANSAELEYLGLISTQVSNAGLAPFANCQHLHVLRLENTAITDEGLRGFEHCPLRELDVERTAVTDDGIARFLETDTLKELDVRQSQVTASMIERLRLALPQCRISWDGGVHEPVE